MMWICKVVVKLKTYSIYVQEGVQNVARVSVVRFLVAFRVIRQARGQGCNVLDGECAPRAPCAVALALELIDRAALRCSALLFITKIWRRGAARGRRPRSALTPRKQLSECSAGNGSPPYLPGARTRRTLARLARSLQKMPHALAFAVILASTGRLTPLHADSTCKLFNECTRVVVFLLNSR